MPGGYALSEEERLKALDREKAAGVRGGFMQGKPDLSGIIDFFRNNWAPGDNRSGMGREPMPPVSTNRMYDDNDQLFEAYGVPESLRGWLRSKIADGNLSKAQAKALVEETMSR